MAKNSFDHPVNEVHFGTYKPSDVRPALERALGLADKRIKEILAIPNSKRTYENTLLALNDANEELNSLAAIVGYLYSTLGDEWFKVDKLVTEKYSDFSAKLLLHTKLYRAVKHLQDNQNSLSVSEAKKRDIHNTVIAFERNGVALPADKKKQLKALFKRHSKLGSDFGQNATVGSDKAHIVVGSKDDLAGVEPELINEWQKLAKSKKISGFYVPYSPPNFDAIMVRCSVKSTRVAFFKASLTRAPKNEKLIEELLAIRRQISDLLGYKNPVDYVVENRMAKSSTKVSGFLGKLYKQFKPAMLKESKELQDFIRDYEGDPTYKLDPSDVMSGLALFYANKMRAEKLSVDEEALREYLPLDQVVKGMFETLHILYGVTIKPAKLPLPHKDARAYNVYDEHNKHLATVWCDWFARKGKRAGAWCQDIYTAERAAGVVDAPHLGVVCANFQAPSKNKPALLTIRDAETIWHEFGHFVHFCLGRTELRAQNGFHVKWDFVEAPSQIMENWIWTDEVLAKIGKHYKTGAAIPKQAVNKLRKARNFRAASRTMWTLYWSTLDQLVHTQYDPSKDGSVTQYSRLIKNRFFPVKALEEDSAICTMLHLFSGGYHCAYYSYLWAEVIEADLFSRFEKEGVLNPKTGREYRDKVLARGDEVDPDELVRDFLGRDFTPEALLRRSGLK